jgi:thiol-disulfide isomerase/thioredoxin
VNIKSFSLIATLMACLGVGPLALASDPVGQPAPGFTLPLRAGTAPLTLEGLRGQVVMINFWASWCGPCREEFPLLDQMYRQYKGIGFTMLGVNVEPDSKDAEGFLAKTPVSFPIVFDRDSTVSKLYRVEGMPSTVLIDRKGVLRWVHRGYKSGDIDEYLNQVRTLIRER